MLWKSSILAKTINIRREHSPAKSRSVGYSTGKIPAPAKLFWKIPPKNSAEMEVVRISTDGRITLPKLIRDARGWFAGTELAVEDTPGGITLRPLKQSPSRLKDVVGCLRYEGRAKTLRQMEKAVALGVNRRRDRGGY